MLKLIKNGEVYSPDYIGKKDILICDGKIGVVSDHISIDIQEDYIEVVDASEKIIIPGLIDGHVHITGGGGEGSFRTRTPELMLSDCVLGGVTTVVGLLGTDGTARTMENLVAKAKGLTEEGISCYCVSGNYHFPVKTLTGSVEKDVMFIQEIIGAGEIAISDHRSSQPTEEELAKLASESRIGALLSGKGGIVIVHVGNGPGKLDLLEQVVQKTDVPIKQFLPTHINRTEELLEAGVYYAKKGGYIDLTTSSVQKNAKLSSSKCLKYLLEEGVSIEQITFTSDGQGSLPKFDDNGDFIGLGVGRLTSLFQEIRNAIVVEGIPIEKALKVATSNPASILKLLSKGRIKEGLDGDIVMLSKDNFSIEAVMAKGNWMMKEKEVLMKGTFE
ncbi:beta-aspartyl-peptidase [Evansella sp. AB-P1]|uniref:beta-aspartyl-peptidase n=1 Tax=Evansella sp. AB-P1 TaxID=3037653 RepID=UPI00241F2171|nr:beta-aspartyl-peptidase [Evansella sp. AB-P1]MDG5786811.1 beta-aspartyl-peptidase [Evansella sp. AB-P1]